MFRTGLLGVCSLAILCWFSVMTGCGEITVSKLDGCENCQERCVADGEGQGRCVSCIKDDHCRTTTSPTRKCTTEYVCVCGSDQDCGEGAFCEAASGKCVQCQRDVDCKDPARPICLDFQCATCSPGQSRACTPKDVVLCSPGNQSCTKDGVWGECKGWQEHVCRSDQLCRNALCQCAPGLRECGDVCVDTGANAKHCGQCNKVCAAGTRCAGGECVDKCPADTPTICGDSCVALDTNPLHCGQCDQACKNGTFCRAGKCACASGQAFCDGVCVDIRVDPRHCGGCGEACKDGQVCASGACVATCPKSTPTSCYGACADTNYNPLHCGKCGHACAPDKQCRQGSCKCPVSRQDCDGTCVDTQIHPKHCGQCGKACKEGQVCTNGSCRSTCPPYTPSACYGGCVDLQTNPKHCGACGKACRVDQRCDGGKCVCFPKTQECSGVCVDTQKDRLHCGACGKACGKKVCSKGACVSACGADTPALCYGACVSTQKDANHCGGCGIKCLATEQCIAGKCVCGKGLELCGDRCVDLQSDTQHCGACGQNCTNQELCVNGACTPPCGTKQPLRCGGVCVDPQSDTQHCGQCGNVCKSGEKCCSGACVGGQPGVNEICNNKDDNCDGQIDENLTRPCYTGSVGTKGVGVCMEGKETCLAGQWGTCEGDIVPGLLVCDGRDHDCDGNPDTGCGWLQFLGGTADDFAYSVVVDTKGNTYVAGAFQGTISVGGTQVVSKGKEDILIVKYTKGGKVLWFKTFGATGIDRAWSLAMGAFGDVYVGGEFEGSVTFGNNTFKAQASRDIFVLKLKANGQIAWSTTTPGDELERVDGIAVDSQGQAHIIGTYTQNMTIGSTTHTSTLLGSAFFVAKLSKGGKFLWSVASKSTFLDWGSAIAVDANGNVGVTALFTAATGLGAFNIKGDASSTEDLLVASLDANGNVLWAKGVTGSDRIEGHGIVFDGQGDMYVTGYFDKDIHWPGGTKGTSKGGADIFVARWDSKGNFVWGVTAGGVGEDVGHGIAFDGQGTLYLAGHLSSGARLGTLTTSSAGKTDGFVAELDRNGSFKKWFGVGGAANDSVLGMAVSTGGGLWLSGYYEGIVAFGSLLSTKGFGKKDIFVYRAR